MKRLPVFELKISGDDETGVEAIALVEQPAIEQDFFFFSSAKNHQFSVNDEKMELIGPAMIPNQRIYRRDKDGFEYEVFFSEKTVREIAMNYMKKGLQENINIDHSDTPGKSFVFQSYLTDSDFGITGPKGLDVPEGTWIVGMKVLDADVWSDIKAGKMKGFSIEGLFNQIPVKHSKEVKLFEALKNLNNIIEQISNNES